MVALLVALTLVLSACSTPEPPRHAAVSGAEVQPREIHNVVRCAIYGMDKRIIRDFSGHLCAFLPDGRVAVANGPTLSMRSPSGDVLWQREAKLSHQLNLDLSKTHLLTLVTEAEILDGRLLRSDAVLVLALDGTLTHRFSFFEHLKEIERLLPWKRRLMLHETMATVGSISHANSIYEIPENPYGAVNPAFRAGNYIINSLGLHVTLIVDSEMKTVLWGMPLEHFGTVQTHDAQVLPNGHLLFYRNEGSGFRLGGCCSALVEYDLERDAPAWTWQETPAERFLATAMGGVQVLSSGNILFNNGILGYAREITPSGRPVWDMRVDLDDLKMRSFQSVKRFDLSSFLERNRDLSSIPFQSESSGRSLSSQTRAPDQLYGYFNEWRLPLRSRKEQLFLWVDPRVRVAKPVEGVDILVNGVHAPIFMLQAGLFGIQVDTGASRVSTVEVYVQGARVAAMVSRPLEAYPGIYLAEFGPIR